LNKMVVARGLAVAFTAVAGYEGLRTVAYLDPVGVPTVCFGETNNVRLGMKFSTEQCNQMLAQRIIEFDDAVTACLRYAPTHGPRTAFVSLAYNIGTVAFCRSTLAQYARAGDIFAACNEIPKFVYAGGVVWPGLVKRRAEEQQLCLSSFG
jgi:lysozyme